jgi:hypothetical protein
MGSASFSLRDHHVRFVVSGDRAAASGARKTPTIVRVGMTEGVFKSPE